jgi:hypothetical protein
MRYNNLLNSKLNLESKGILLLNDRVVKSKLALRGMTVKDLTEAIDEHYNSVYDVIHGKWGTERGIVADRILNKISHYLGIPELSKEKNHENT